MSDIGIGLIGTGFMGKCHAMAFRAVPAVFEGTAAPRLAMLADVDPAHVERIRSAWGFERGTTDWRELVRDPEVQVVAITTPNFLHQEMAVAAIEAGKHVYCEKPLATGLDGARAMAEAAQAAGVGTLVGYNYIRAPAARLAKEMIDAGEIGEVIHFRGIHFEDFMLDPAVPRTWRCEKARAGSGALGDMGSHVLSLARFFVGEVEAVSGSVQTMIRERPDPADPSRWLPVDVDDQVQALLRFESGAAGTLEASWLAAGRKAQLAFEITGTRGALMLDYERTNELRVFESGTPKRGHGFKTVLMGPAHPPYAQFCPAPGHQLGFNDLKVIEVKALLDGLAGEGPLDPDFAAAERIATVVEAILRSAEAGHWVRIRDV